jgi:hypothetical protein
LVHPKLLIPAHHVVFQKLRKVFSHCGFVVDVVDDLDELADLDDITRIQNRVEILSDERLRLPVEEREGQDEVGTSRYFNSLTHVVSSLQDELWLYGGKLDHCFHEFIGVIIT